MEGIRVVVDPEEGEAWLSMAGYRIGDLHMTFGVFRVWIGYVVEVEVVDKGRHTASAAWG